MSDNQRNTQNTLRDQLSRWLANRETATMPAPPQSTPLPPSVFAAQQSHATPAIAQSVPNSNKKFPLPKLRLEIRDVMHPGAQAFLEAVIASTALEYAVRQVLNLLYESPDCRTTHVPGTRSVTLVLERYVTKIRYSFTSHT